LNKCFANINGLETSDKLDITHIISFEFEKLELPKNIRIRGATEHWLGALESGMFDSIKRHLKVPFIIYSFILFFKYFKFYIFSFKDRLD
jgi:hypothetical protein